MSRTLIRGRENISHSSNSNSNSNSNTVAVSAVTGLNSRPCESREQSLQEVLEISFGVLRSHYLAGLGQQLQSASCWQSAEAALFGIRSDPLYHKLLLYLGFMV